MYTFDVFTLGQKFRIKRGMLLTCCESVGYLFVWRAVKALTNLAIDNDKKTTNIKLQVNTLSYSYIN